MPFPVLATIDLASIDDGMRWNIHPFLYTTVSPGLKASCERFGILRPPLALEGGDGRYELLDGRQRTAIARDILGLRQCPCYIIPATLPVQFLLAMLFESQSCTAPLSPMEAAHFLNLHRQVLATTERSSPPFDTLFAERQGFEASRRSDRLLQLEDNLQEMVHTLFLTEAMGHDLLKLEAEDRQRLAALFKTFGMGGGKQKRFFSLIRDIAGRNATSIAAILDQPPIRDILLHQEMNQPQKVHAMLSVLQQLASPSLSAAEETFRQRVAALDPPPGCGIQHSQSFETDDVDLTIRFRDFNQLEQSWPTVKEMLRRNAGQR